ncbi:hypothetical protein RIF29_20925 [Crotalaria pallida]|uniref:Uncharacterized protein n=1 Tax=Crotalaria pallida TaxID=3830 RepID=A0AAN9F6H9_CROPI
MQRVQEQIDKGHEFVQTVEDSELHPLVVETVSQNASQTVKKSGESQKEDREEEWQTVMTRRRTAQMKKDSIGDVKKGDGGSTSSLNPPHG